MSIKSSELEKRWYYRFSKVLFLIVPLLVGVFLYFKTKLNLFYIGGGLVAYYFLLITIWRLFLYIAFGGLEDDISNKESLTPASKEPTSENIAGPLILLIIFIIAMLYFAFAKGIIKLPGNLSKNISNLIQTTETALEKVFHFTNNSHQYGEVCYVDNQKGLYGKDGHCYTCSTGSASTSQVGTCSEGVSGIYCCGPSGSSSKNSSPSSRSGTNTNNTTKESGTKCIPTGCGNFWRCTGYYYFYPTGQRINVDSCFPTPAGEISRGSGWEWNGTCRQCP